MTRHRHGRSPVRRPRAASACPWCCSRTPMRIPAPRSATRCSRATRPRSRITPLPERITVLVVQPDERSYAPVRATLARIERPRYEIHWVTSATAARAALDEHPHDAFLVDCGSGGLELATEILAHRRTPPSCCSTTRADRDTDVAAAEAGITEYVTDLDLLERALRYAITHQHALARLAESEQRYALAMQGANDGLWDWDVRDDRLYFSPRWKQMLGYGEPELGDAPGEWLARVHPDDRAALSQALDAHLAGASAPLRARAPDPAPRRLATAGCSPAGWRCATPTAAPTRVVGCQTDVTDRKRGRAAPPARRAARRADRAAEPRAVPRPPRPGDPPRPARRRRRPPPPCCSSTSTASSSSTTRSATRSATSC